LGIYNFNSLYGPKRVLLPRIGDKKIKKSNRGFCTDGFQVINFCYYSPISSQRYVSLPNVYAIFWRGIQDPTSLLAFESRLFGIRPPTDQESTLKGIFNSGGSAR